MGFLQEGLDVLGGWVRLFGGIEGGDGSLKVFRVELILRLKDKGREGTWAEGKGFRAVGLSFLLVVHLKNVSVRSFRGLVRKKIFVPLGRNRKPSQPGYCKAHWENAGLCDQPPWML